MGASSNTVDSNQTGLRYAEETIGSPGVVGGGAVWYPLEPNSYGEFGAQTVMTARDTINPSRQRRKGTVTDLDVAGGFQIDFTDKDIYRLMQGFTLSTWSENTNLQPSAVSATQYTVASGGTGFLVGGLLFAEGFAVPGNNGLHSVTASAATTVTASGLAVEAAPPAGATITYVGQQGATADLAIVVNSGIPSLTSTTLNFTTLNFAVGEWIFIGGDGAAFQFATPANNGFYRIKTIGANAIVFDRWPSTPVADAGAGKTIQIFFGHIIKNEPLPANQVFRTFQWERQLKSDSFEYLKGTGANTMSVNITNGDKVTVDLGFVGLGAERLSAGKAGTRPALPGQAAFNASTSFSRVRFSNDSSAASLGTYLTDLTLTIDNGMTPAKAIGYLGGFDLNAGSFKVAGAAELYFSNYAAIDAIQANIDASLDFAMVENYGANAVGWYFDIPLLGLGGGRVKIEKDRPVKLPITYDAAGHATLDYTLRAQRFAYLPQAAL